MTGPATGASPVAAPNGAAAPRLALRGVRKAFGGARALDGVDLVVAPGEVHGLLGENGCGKSTLIKVLNGFHAPDAGTLEIDGTAVSLPLPPGRFQELGLSFVHQDLGLIPELTALENLRMVGLSQSRSWRVDWADEARRARGLFADYGLEHIDPEAVVGDLSATDRALLAIVRAVDEMRQSGQTGGLLVLDEPTVFLPREGVERLFSIVREVASRGVSVLFVSHDIDEVLAITDRVTVLRDGRVFGTTNTQDVDSGRLIEMIIGRPLAELEAATAHRRSSSGEAFVVRGVTGGLLDGLDLDLRTGEITGVTGLMGSGFEDVPYALFGTGDVAAGVARWQGRELDLTSLRAADALEAGLALVPADRHRDGALMTLSVLDNLMMQVLGTYRPWRLDGHAMRRRAAELLTEFQVQPNAPDAVYGALSGGNQQKVLLAKWLEAGPSVLLLHEPTQGVDVGAREQIFRLLGQAADAGISVLCASSDHEQLALLCDSVVVLSRGRAVRELRGGELTKEQIAQCVYNSATEAVVAERSRKEQDS